MYKTDRFIRILLLLFVPALVGCPSRKNSIPTIVIAKKVGETHQDPQRSFIEPDEEPDQFEEDLDRVKVPNVLRLSEDEAEKLIEDAGLKVGNTIYRESTVVAPGTVLDQSPKPNEEVAKGSSIKLWWQKPEKKQTD